MGLTTETTMSCGECAQIVYNLLEKGLQNPDYEGISVEEPETASVLDGSGTAYTIDIIEGGDNLGVAAIFQSTGTTFMTWECYTKDQRYPINLEDSKDLLNRIMASKEANDEEN